MSDINFSNINEEAKINRSHILNNQYDPNLSISNTMINKSHLNMNTLNKKNENIFPQGNINGGLNPEERKSLAINQSNLSEIPGKKGIAQSSEFLHINNGLTNLSMRSNVNNNLENSLQKDRHLYQNSVGNNNSHKIVFPNERDNADIKSIYSIQSKDFDNSRINKNNITNSINDGISSKINIDNSYFNKQTNNPRSTIEYQNISISKDLYKNPNNFNEKLNNHNPIEFSKINHNDEKNQNFSVVQKHNIDPFNSYLITQNELNENDIVMLDESGSNKMKGNLLSEEVRVGAYGGKINNPHIQCSFRRNESDSLYEDSKSDINHQIGTGAYGNNINRNNSCLNENTYLNDESKKNISSEKYAENNNFFYTLKKRNTSENLIDNEFIVASGNPDLNLNKPSVANPLTDYYNTNNSKQSQKIFPDTYFVPNDNYKDYILGRSELEIDFNNNQSDFILNDKKPIDEDFLKDPELIRRNSFFSPNPIQNKKFQQIFEKENAHFNEFRNFQLNDEDNKTGNYSISNIEKNIDYNSNNNYKIHLVEANHESINCNMPSGVNYQTNPMNDYFFSDIDEENKNRNFKNLLETEHSKSKLKSFNRNETNPVNNFYEIRPDNSYLNFSCLSNNLIESQRRETDNIEMKIPRPNFPSKNSFNNTINYGDKIKTIFDEPNEEYFNKSNTNFRKISVPNNLNTSNPNNQINTTHDKRNTSLSNLKNVNISQANIVNYYNFNFNNNFKVNHDTQIKDLDLTVETRSFMNPPHGLDTNTILKTDNMESDKLIPEEEKFNKSNYQNDLVPEFLVCNKSPIDEIPTLNIDNIKLDITEHDNESLKKESVKDDIHFLIKNTEENMDHTIFENSIIEINKNDYKLLRNSDIQNHKPNAESLTNFYGKNFLKDWNDQGIIKIANNKKGIREDKYFYQGFLNEYNIIDFTGESIRDYIKSLDSLENDIQTVKIDLKSNNIFEAQEIFIYNPKDTFDYNNKLNEVEKKKKELLDYLQQRGTKSTFNKISYLYDNQVLNQKYRISNEKIFLETKDESIVFTSSINRNLDRDLISQLNTMNDVNNEYTRNKNNLYIINEVDSILENNKKGKSYYNKDTNNDGRIHLWRESICDGNSFYRMFMFSYLEYLIFKKDINLLAKIFKRIEMDFLNKNKINVGLNENLSLDLNKLYLHINFERVLMIFNFIINFMRLKDYKSSYNALNNAFNDIDNSFDRVKINLINKKILNIFNCKIFL